MNMEMYHLAGLSPLTWLSHQAGTHASRDRNSFIQEWIEGLLMALKGDSEVPWCCRKVFLDMSIRRVTPSPPPVNEEANLSRRLQQQVARNPS